MFPVPGVVRNKDTSLSKRYVCRGGRHPSTMDTEREYDGQLYSPFVRTPAYTTWVGKGGQITFQIFRISLSFTPRCKINKDQNFVIFTIEF